MDVNALRVWGIAVSGALMAAALAIAFTARESQTPALTAMGEPAGAPSQVMAADAPVEFIVRFRGGGPIARAQARAEQGDLQRAQREVERQLVRQRAFAGLCFERFTLGGAEIVLRACQAIAAEERASVQTRWAERLRGMRAVDYVDVNVAASPEQTPG